VPTTVSTCARCPWARLGEEASDASEALRIADERMYAQKVDGPTSALCDAYDAIVADRPYQSARSSAEAMAELRRCAGTQFDPQVVAAFAAAFVARQATVSRDAAV
jgi:hypothetical protein